MTALSDYSAPVVPAFKKCYNSAMILPAIRGVDSWYYCSAVVGRQGRHFGLVIAHC